METDVINNSFPNRVTSLTFESHDSVIPTDFDIYKKNSENPADDEFLRTLIFHEGSTENYIDGVLEEDLVLMVLTRLNYAQQTSSACVENAESILYLEKVLQAMSKRKENNEKKNDGIYII